MGIVVRFVVVEVNCGIVVRCVVVYELWYSCKVSGSLGEMWYICRFVVV